MIGIIGLIGLSLVILIIFINRMQENIRTLERKQSRLKDLSDIIEQSIAVINRQRRSEKLQKLLDIEKITYWDQVDRIECVGLGALKFDSEQELQTSEQRVHDFINGRQSNQYLTPSERSYIGASSSPYYEPKEELVKLPSTKRAMKRNTSKKR